MRRNYFHHKLAHLILSIMTVLLLVKVNCALAADTNITGPSLGDMARSMLVPVSIMGDLLYKMFYIIGAALVVGSGIQYKAHRDNPSQVPINRPILLLIIGLVFIAVPLIAQYSSASSTISS